MSDVLCGREKWSSLKDYQWKTLHRSSGHANAAGIPAHQGRADQVPVLAHAADDTVHGNAKTFLAYTKSIPSKL